MDGIYKILERTKHHDKDERYMAISDLKEKLEASTSIDAKIQPNIRDTILLRLKDDSSDVQAIAVNCLGAIVQKFSLELAVEMVSELGNLAITGKIETRDNYSQGIRTILKSLPPEFGAEIATKLAPILLSGLSNPQTNIDNRVGYLIILADLLNSYGSLFTSLHKSILNSFMELLEHQKAALRKEASIAIGALVKALEDEEFSILMKNLIRKTKEKSKDDELLFNYVQTIAVVTRSAGPRLEKSLHEIIPLLDAFCDADKPIDQSDCDPLVVDLREASLLAFSSLIRECSSLIVPYFPRIIKIAFKLVTHDPNYLIAHEETEMDVDGEDEGHADWEDEGDGDWGEGFDNVLVSEDSDSTWKVRLASIYILSAFIETKSDIFRSKFSQVFDLIMKRMEERDLNVRSEVFKAFCLLLRVSSGIESRIDDSDDIPDQPKFFRQMTSFSTLIESLPSIAVKLEDLYRAEDSFSKKGVLLVLLELSKICHSQMLGYLEHINPILIQSITSVDAELRYNGLSVLQRLLLSKLNPSADDQLKFSRLDEITSAVVQALDDSFVRTRTLALFVIQAISKTLLIHEYPEMTRLSQILFSASFKLLKMQELDQSIKEASILTVASLISSYGTVSLDELRQAFDLIMSRLANTLTQSAALKGISQLYSSNNILKGINFLSSLPVVMENCFTAISRNAEEIRNQAIHTLQTICKCFGSTFSKAVVESSLAKFRDLLKFDDFNLSQSLWTLIGEFNSTSSLKHSIDDGLVKSLLEKLIGFLQNELLQNSALLNLSKCISSFLCIKSSSASFKNIFDLLMKSAAASKNHFMLRCSAICMANLISSSPQDVRQTVDFFVKSIQSGNLSNQALALLVISELAKTSDLSFSEKLEAYVHNALSSPDEIVRLSAATCLGGITSGNLGRYLVALLKKLEEATVSGSLYLLMNAVKETISISQRSIYPFLNDLLRVILGKISVSDETIQLIIAECLGRLLHVSAEQVLPVLERLVNSASPADRFVSVSAVKYVTNLEVSFLKRINFSIFFDHIIDSDLSVSRQALLTFQFIASSNSNIFEEFGKASLREVWIPAIYQQCCPRPELVKEVDFGAFKERLDEHLPTRKAAFQCLLVLLKRMSHVLKMKAFLERVSTGCNDEELDIVFQAYEILRTSSTIDPPAVYSILDTLPDALMPRVKDLLKMAKSSKINEQRTAKELLLTFVLLMRDLLKIPKAEQARAFNIFQLSVSKTALLKSMMEELDSKKS